MSVLPRLLGDQEVSAGDLSETAAVLRALSHPARLRLLRHLAHASGQIATVGQLARRMDLAHSTVSQHLARLAVMGLITKHPSGHEIFCVLAPEALARIAAFLTPTDPTETP
ncbi:metalloregulator ArsR/SmtB family transcription factor [Phytomonospora sp. NPDC050363]|uniref:ArsR/SmtB family transcription factor n=1 Tax=Phytomonospora sp. NPDC050363 TaxID=3155642 RepID=UPI0033C27DA2